MISSALAAVVGVTLTFALFRRLSAKTPPRVSKSMEELSAEYGRWEAFALVPIFICTAVLTYIWYNAIRMVVEALGPSRLAEGYLIVPENAFWALPAFFLGIISAAVPVDFLYRMLLRERYAEFNAWQHLKLGFDGSRMLGYLAVLVALGTGVFVTLGLDSYVRFTESEIVVNPVPSWGKERRYSYEMVSAIEERSSFRAPNGNVKAKRHHALIFIDGTEWRTLDGLRDPRVSTDREIMRYVAQLAGKGIDEVTLGLRDQN